MICKMVGNKVHDEKYKIFGNKVHTRTRSQEHLGTGGDGGGRRRLRPTSYLLARLQQS